MTTIESIKQALSGRGGGTQSVSRDVLALVDSEAAEPIEPEPMPEDQSEPEDMLPVEEPEPMEPTPKFAEGAMVSSMDPMRPPGKIYGDVTKQYCYHVRCENGLEYVEAESQLENYMGEEPMGTTDTAAEGIRAVAVALGLSDDSTLDNIVHAVNDLKDQRDVANAEALAAHLFAAGVKDDLADVMASAVVRNDGEDWGDAVKRVKAAKPSAFDSVGTFRVVSDGDDVNVSADGGDADDCPTVTGAVVDGGKVDPAKVAIEPKDKMPAGVSAGKRDEPATVVTKNSLADRNKEREARASARRIG